MDHLKIPKSNQMTKLVHSESSERILGLKPIRYFDYNVFENVYFSFRELKTCSVVKLLNLESVGQKHQKKLFLEKCEIYLCEI